MLYITLALWVASTNLEIQEQFERKTAGQDSMTRRLRMVREDTGRDLAKVPPGLNCLGNRLKRMF